MNIILGLWHCRLWSGHWWKYADKCTQ